MASTWTLNNAIEKIADGEKTDTWGQITNRNFDIIDRAANGVGTIDLSSSAAAHTLATTDGSTGDALTDGMYKVLVLDGATEACTITITPNDAAKLYLVHNNSGQTCTFTQGSGASISIVDGGRRFIYCDGGGATAAVVEVPLTSLADLNVTATADELNYNDITTLGTSEASKTVTADANGTVKFGNNAVGTSTSLTSSSNAITLNCRSGNDFTHTLTENTTFTFSNAPASGTDYTFSVKITQDASATGYTVTWPASVVWPYGNTPVLTDIASADDYFVFITHDGGTTFYGFPAGYNLG